MTKSFHSAPPAEREALRLRAVEAVLAGERRGEVARRSGVTRQTLYSWLRRHRLAGPRGLAEHGPGRPPRALLDPRDEAAMIETITASPPLHAGLAGTCWTRKAVAALLERRHGLRASHWQVDRLLRRWGFRAHKEVRRAFRTRPAAVDTLLAAVRGRGPELNENASPRGI